MICISGVFVMIIFFLVSKMLILGGYSINNQAICHMGRIWTKKGEKNIKAAVFLIGIFSIEAILIVLLGNLLATHAKEDNIFTIISYLCYFTAICSVLTAIIPIDLYEKLHLFAAFTYFISLNVWIITLMSYLWILGMASLFMQLILILISLTTGFYIGGYLKNYRYTAIFQKIWILFVTIGLVMCIQFFSAF